MFSFSAISQTITSRYPGRNQNTFVQSSIFAWKFNQTMALNAADANRIFIHSRYKGSITIPSRGGFSGAGTDSLFFTPYNPLLKTDHFTITLTNTILSALSSPINPETYQANCRSSAAAAHFLPPSTFVTTLSNPSDIESGDLDDDNDIDVIIVNPSSINVFKNDGVGNFSFFASYTESLSAKHNCLADFDNDGDLDVATTIDNSGSTDSVKVRLNNGNGTFAAPVAYLAHNGSINSSGIQSIQYADFNRDGFQDIVIKMNDNLAVNYFSIRMNNGNGTFSPSTVISYGSNQGDISIFDVENDGDMDICAGYSSLTGTTTFRVFTNTGASPFFTINGFSNISFSPALGAAVQPILSDFDNDGDMDLGALTAGAFYVKLNNGSGSFGANSTFSINNSLGSRGFITDWNGDGFTDVMLLGGSTTRTDFLTNNGSAGFTNRQDRIDANLNTVSKDIADIDGDGDMDLITCGAQFLSVYRNSFETTITSGASFIPNTAFTNTNQPIGRFAIRGAFVNGTVLNAVNIQLNGTRRGLRDFKLWKSTDSLFSTTSNNTLISAVVPTDPGTGNQLIFSGLNDNITTTTNWYYVTVDLDSNVSGNIRPMLTNNHSFLFNNALAAPAFQFLPLVNDTTVKFSPILSLNPSANSQNAPFSSSINITFNQSLTSNPDTNGVRIFSDFFGLRSRSNRGSLLGGNTPNYSFAPNNSLRPAERIDVSITTKTKFFNGIDSVIDPVVYGFKTRSGVASARFDRFGSTIPIYSTNSIKACDVDGDWDIDIIAVNRFTGDMQVYTNNGIGTYTLNVSYAFGSNQSGRIELLTGDVDGDGDVDVVSPANFSVQVYKNDGLGNYAAYQNTSCAYDPRKAELGDLDADGDLDLVVVYFVGSTARFATFRNNGLGNYTLWTEYIYNTSQGSATPTDVFLKDLDKDGDLDLTFALGEYGIYTYTNTGNGTFTNKNYISDNRITYFIACMSDIDNDGDLDFIGAQNNGSALNKAIIIRYNTNGSFSTSSLFNYSGSDGLLVEDYNGDNMQDIFAGGELFLNTGGGNFTQPERIMDIRPTLSFDVDGDGDLDFISSQGNLLVCRNTNTTSYIKYKSGLKANYQPTGFFAGTNRAVGRFSLSTDTGRVILTNVTINSFANVNQGGNFNHVKLWASADSLFSTTSDNRQLGATYSTYMLSTSQLINFNGFSDTVLSNWRYYFVSIDLTVPHSSASITNEMRSLGFDTNRLYLNENPSFTFLATTLSVNLPVKYLNFNAIKEKENCLLTWQTGSELNNDYFEIERSLDGITFNTIATVQGNGTSSNTHSYQYLDENLQNLNNGTLPIYYRLKQVDFDGKTSLSNIVSIEFVGFNLYKVYPNPASNILAIETNEQEQFLVELFDMTNKKVLEASNSKEINIQDLNKGLYFVRITNKKGAILLLQKLVVLK